MKWNSINYPVVTPKPVDLLLVRQASSGNVKSATVQSLSGAIAGVNVVETIADLRVLSTDGLADNAVAIVLGYYEAGDGGGGEFYYSPTSSLPQNNGTVITPDDLQGRWISPVANAIFNVVRFGAKGDGVTDDTVAVGQAYAAAVANGGGKLYFPSRPGKLNYIARLLILDGSIGLLGDNGIADFNESTIYAPDISAPTITVGNDTAFVRNNYFNGISVCGDTIGGLHSPSAIKYAGGSWNGGASQIEVSGGVKTLWFEGGPNFGSSGISFDQFHIRQDWSDATSRAIYVKRTGLGFSTNIAFGIGAVSSHAGYAVEIDGETLFMGIVYIDCDPGAGFYFNGGRCVAGGEVTLDPAVTGAVVIKINDTLKDPARYLVGQFNVALQKMEMSDASTITFPDPAGSFSRNQRLLAPFINEVYISPLSDPYNTTVFFDTIAAGGPLRLNGTYLQMPGTTLANNAPAGCVGEEKEVLVAEGAGVALTDSTPATVMSLLLTPGDWDIEGNINFVMTNTTLTLLSGGIRNTATIPTDGSQAYSGLRLTTTSTKSSIAITRKRISIAAGDTYNLVAQANFSAGSVAASGVLTARRVR